MTEKNIRDKIKSGARIIDVRTVDEFSDGHYPGAENIPVDLILSETTHLGHKDQNIVLYCASGARSAAALRKLKDLGFTNVVNAGGLDDMPT